jgi:hypothetical protein
MTKSRAASDCIAVIQQYVVDNRNSVNIYSKKKIGASNPDNFDS